MNNLINFNFDDLKKLVYREFSQQQQQEMINKRNHLIQFDVNVPKYLLETEIKTLFSFIENYNELMLLKVLWFTGARISEVLMLTPKNFLFRLETCLISLPVKKKRKLVKKINYDENGIKKVQKIYETITSFRHIELSKKNQSQREFIEEIKRYIVTNNIKNDKLLFNYTRFQVNRLITKNQNKALKNGVKFPFKITPHTFRHSCAMNLYYNNVDEKVIKEYLGHSRIENTRIYTQLFHLENDISHVNF